jgi:hypothetical protein
MPIHRSNLFRILAAILIFIVLCGLLGVALQRIFADNIPGLDLYITWTAGRALFTQQLNPYSQQVTEMIQLGMHGRLIAPGEDPMRFAYPPYALLLIAPLLPFSFDWTQALWLAFNVLALVTCTRLALPKSPLWVMLTVFAFYPIAFGLILGNFAILISAILLLCLGRILFSEVIPTPAEQVILGVMLALASVKPQFSALMGLVLGIHALRRRQWHFLASLGGGMAVLLFLSFVVLPNWPSAWLGQLGQYTRDNPYTSPLLDYLALFLPTALLPIGVQIARGLIVAVTVGTLAAWALGRLQTLPLLAWCGAAVFLLDMNGISYDQIPFLIPLLLWAGVGKPRPKGAGWVVLIVALSSWVLFWLDTHGLPGASNRLLFLFILPWMVYLFIRKPIVTTG